MRDDSFRGLSFTCHCPIRTRDTTTAAATTNIVNAKVNREGEGTQEQKMPSSNPRPRNTSRWRFSTRQQTYGAVTVSITIRGVGGSKSVIDYHIALREGAPETIGTFVEKRPNSIMRPIKMTDGNFAINLLFGVDYDNNELPLENGAENRILLQQIAKSIFGRSKRPMRAVLHNPNNGESWTEEWFKSKKEKSNIDDVAWTLSFVRASSSVGYHPSSNVITQSQDTVESDLVSTHVSSTEISILSPSLSGGEGLNECYKIIEGLPSYLTCTNQNEGQGLSAYTPRDHSLHVQIDVSNLTILQIIKVCQNFIKYEEAIDSFMPWYRRENCFRDCLSNKLAMKGDKTQQQLNNKERNNMIARCTSFRDLIHCLNPEDDRSYKLNLRNLINSTNNKLYIEFRQHPTSKDKTTTTNWIRLCMAFVKNSARLRSPNALKNTTSIEDEFDLLFEYVVKDRALRNFYRERRDVYAAREEEGRMGRLKMEADEDDMSISDSDSVEVSNANSNLKREAETLEVNNNKRHCH